MVRSNVIFRFLSFSTLLVLLLVSSCVEKSGVRRKTQVNRVQGDGGTNGSSDSDSVAPVDGGIGSGTTAVVPKVEIRHLIEPKINETDTGGTYTRKLTIPKNYDKLLYVAGINISTLSSKNVKVRFRFGLTSEPIDVPATVATAAGLTPQTGVEVLVMDLRYRPFEDLKLIYDLFDYNDYTFLGSSSPSAKSSPVLSNRDSKLFCRGLAVQHDPTFSGSVQDGCKNATDVCKYAYAKVVDKGLVREEVDPTNALLTIKVPITPTEPNVQSGTNGLYKDTDAIATNRCLPDNPLDGAVYRYVYKNDPSVPITTIINHNAFTTILSKKHFFEGPYKSVNSSNWQIKASAVYGANGIFGDAMSGADIQTGIRSKLFPLYTKLNLSKDIEYLGSSTPTAAKTLQTMSANGSSEWMDGCNERATSVDTNTGEGVGSCTVTATMEIISVDDDGKETIEATSTEVKLQLVKPAAYNADGENVLLPSFQSCTSTNQCGSDQCCFNKRCWDKSLVSQCVEDANAIGNKIPGQTCASDFECSSLCCNQSTGKCGVHDTLQDPPVYCSKSSGQFCIAKEWCAKQTVRKCFIVKTGRTLTGAATCALRCYTMQAFGDCENGTCKPPAQPAMPVFNPDNVNCETDAIDPPNFNVDGTDIATSSNSGS